MWPVTLPGSWVASTKPEAVIARRECEQPFQGRGRTLAPRDRGPGSMADVAGYITRVAAVAGRRDWTRETLADGVREGDRRALARAITLVENRDALAYDVVADVYPETVGTGQSEVEIVGIADTVLLVLMPGSGDSVQALKAGIMEIPDVIAVNKMDHPAAKTMLSEVRSILSLDRTCEWRPPIVLTEAIRGENVEDLWEKILAHRSFLESSGRLDEPRRRNLSREVFSVASGRARQHLEHAVADDPELRRLLDEVQGRRLDPLSAVREILEKVFRIGDTNGTRPS